MRRFLVPCSLVLFFPPLAFSQGGEGRVQPKSSTIPNVKIHGMSADQMNSTLRSRERETLHPGDPLKVVGHEEGDNDFRHDTPLLVEAVVGDLAVDLDAMRERRLAMYSEPTVFHSPLQPFAIGGDSASLPVALPPKPAPAPIPGAEKEKPAGQSGLLILLGIGVFCGLLAFVYRKRLAS